MQSPQSAQRYYSKRFKPDDELAYANSGAELGGSRSVGRDEVAARTRAALQNGFNENDVQKKGSVRSYAARAQERPDLALDTSVQQSDSFQPPTGFSFVQDDDLDTQFDAPRKDSVPDRSPLQKLEVTLGDISKEEKRARVIEAEDLSRQRSSARKARRVSIPKEYTERSQQTKQVDERRVVSDGQEATRGTSAKTNTSSGASYTNPRGNGFAAGATSRQGGWSEGPRQGLGRYESINTRTRRYGHDAALTGSAAAAAVNALQRSGGTYDAAMDTDNSSSTSENYHSPKGPSPETQSLGKALVPDNISKPGSSAVQKSRGSTLVKRKPAGQNTQPGRAVGSDTDGISQTKPPAPVSMRHAGNGMAVPNHTSIQTSRSAPQNDVPAQKTQSGFAEQPQSPDSLMKTVPISREDQREQLTELQNQKTTPETSKTSDEWKNGHIAILTAKIMNSDLSQAQYQPWWERNESEHRRTKSSAPVVIHQQVEQQERSVRKSFQPSLTLKCGPLLRYTGLKSSTSAGEDHNGQTFWRGSIMIVTDDADSSLQTPPKLRLFKQQMSLIPAPKMSADGQFTKQLSPQSLDPIAGQMKCSSKGETLVVKPVHSLQATTDLSQIEGDSGLFQTARSANDCEKAFSRIESPDGEQKGLFAEVTGHRLHIERHNTFWRFNIEVELTNEQTRIAYRVNNGPAIGFWVPARNQPMNIMLHSCNGFNLSASPEEFSGPDPLWRDALAKHQSQPFHVMIGAGNQIYNDKAQTDTKHFQEWLGIKNPQQKHMTSFTSDMQYELETFYMESYLRWFSGGMFSMANAQIPMINIWDDHDIIDGFGTYPDNFMKTPVFSGLGGVAFKYYMLFQHQTVIQETQRDEPSWILGTQPGPYIHQLSRSIFAWLGRDIAFVGIDCRTERTREDILSQESYDMIFDRLRREVIKGETKHLLVLLGVPITYPRLNFLENMFSSKAMDPVKAIGRTGILGGLLNKYDGGVEVLEDLNDHWTAKHHKLERNWLVQELQEFAADNSVRITILGGDVDLGGIGQFYSNRKLGIPKDHDHRYMPNVISSAIANAPPSEMLSDLLKRRNRVHHLDLDTDESMIPMFENDVHGEMRYNQYLMNRRNWCSIKPYDGSLTPPSSPTPPIEDQPQRKKTFSFGRSNSLDGDRPSSLNEEGRPRGKLIKRLSSRKAPPSAFRKPLNNQGQGNSPYGTQDGVGLGVSGAIDRRWNSADAVDSRTSSDQSTKPSFQRRPSNIDDKSALIDRSGREGHINLEHGLEIALNIEFDKKAPAGRTIPYRLIVPALFYSEDYQSKKQNEAAKTGVFTGLVRRLSSRRIKRVTQGTPYDSTTSLGEPHQGATIHDRDEVNANAQVNKASLGLPNGVHIHSNEHNRQGPDWQTLQTLPRASGNIQADVPYQGTAEQTRSSLDRNRSLKRSRAGSNEQRQQPPIPQNMLHQTSQSYVSGAAPPPRRGLDLPLGPVNNRIDRYDPMASRPQPQPQTQESPEDDDAISTSPERSPSPPGKTFTATKDPYAHLYGDSIPSDVSSSAESSLLNIPETGHGGNEATTHLRPNTAGSSNNNGPAPSKQANYPSPLASHTTTSVPGAPPSPLVAQQQQHSKANPTTSHDPYAHYTTTPIPPSSSHTPSPELSPAPPPRNPNRTSSKLSQLYGSSFDSVHHPTPHNAPHQPANTGTRPISVGLSSKAARQLGVDPHGEDGRAVMYGQPIGWQGGDPMAVVQGPGLERFGAGKNSVGGGGGGGGGGSRIGRMARRLSGSGKAGGESTAGGGGAARRSSWKVWK